MPQRHVTHLLVLALLVGGASAGQRTPEAGTLGFFDEIVRLPEGDWHDLRAGRTVVRTIPVEAEADHHVAIVAAGRTTVTPDRFIAGVKNSANLWRGPHVPRSGTFHNPVSAADLASIVLGAEDLRAIRSCRPGDCAIKLAPAEMTRLQQLHAREQPWQQAVQQEFRAIVLERIEAYRRHGLHGLPSPHDHEKPAALDAVFAGLLAAAPALSRHAPSVATYFERYPHMPLPAGTQEVQYWLEATQTPRPTLQAIHAVIQRPIRMEPIEVLVVSRQIFATHYVNGSLSVSALIRDRQDPSRRYLIYVNRSATDGLAGFLSGLRRFFIERRIRGAARGAFEHLRSGLEQSP